MVKLSLFASILTLSAISLVAADPVAATKIKDDLKKAYASGALVKGAKYSDLVIYPQTTIGSADKEACQKMRGSLAKKAKVAVVANDKEIAILFRWPDKTNSKQKNNDTKAFGDGFAVQFPASCMAADKLPYIGMGSEGRPVVVYLEKNTDPIFAPNRPVEKTQIEQNRNLFGDALAKEKAEIAKMAKEEYKKAFVAEGFRSLTEIKAESSYFMDMKYSKGEWSAVLIRPISDENANLGCDTLPVAVAAWDGDKDNRNGYKLLSSWIPVKLKDSKEGAEAAAEISKKVKGNIENGKKTVVEMCVACHVIGDLKAADFLAPNLTNVGGYTTAAYLRESIVSPGAVVVPGYNANAHPTPWYTVENGKRVTTMPAFDYLKPNELDDVVAYLQTLKAGVEK